MSYPQGGPQYPQQPYGQPQHQQWPPTPPRPAPKKSRKWPWIVGVLVVILVVGSVANGGKSSTPTPAPAAAAPALADKAAEPAVESKPDLGFGEEMTTYSVAGTGQASVTYMHDGGQSQKTVKLPWSVNIKTGFVASLVAQKKSGNGAEISCKIVQDNAVIAESASSGPYALTTCSG